MSQNDYWSRFWVFQEITSCSSLFYCLLFYRRQLSHGLNTWNNLFWFLNSMAAVFDYKSWIGRANDWQPKAMIAFHAVAVNTNLQENEGKKLSSLQLLHSVSITWKNLGNLESQTSYFVLRNFTGLFSSNSFLHLCFAYASILKFFSSVPIDFSYTIFFPSFSLLVLRFMKVSMWNTRLWGQEPMEKLFLLESLNSSCDSTLLTFLWEGQGLGSSFLTFEMSSWHYYTRVHSWTRKQLFYNPLISYM